MIFIDPTEARQHTKLHQKILDVAKPLIGLEMATGADLMISPMRTGIPGGNINREPGSTVFPNYAKHAMLIQRKSGHDLIHSIQDPGLFSILARMQKWTMATAWLMVDGSFEKDMNRMTVIDGRPTGFHYHGYQGALDAWQLAGGIYHSETSTEDSADWLLRMDKNIEKFKNGEYHVRAHHPAIHLKNDPRPWRSTLETFPGVGSLLSTVIADHCGDLKTSLWWMTMLGDSDLAGVGTKTKENWREWLELTDDEILMPVGLSDPLALPVQTKELA